MCTLSCTSYPPSLSFIYDDLCSVHWNVPLKYCHTKNSLDAEANLIGLDTESTLMIISGSDAFLIATFNYLGPQSVSVYAWQFMYIA